MRKHTHLLLPVLFVLLFISCQLSKKQEASTPTDYSAQGYRKAIVVDYAIDGCQWMLQLENDKPEDDNKKLEPDYIAPSFQKDGTPVWIKFEKEERLSICMTGETVKIIAIKKS
jgi:hypothetical protein